MTLPSAAPPADIPRCARCHRPLRPPLRTDPTARRQRGIVVAIRRWPEGPICAGCFATACETYGTCPRCSVHRLLPGRAADGSPICTDCAGNIGNFTCSRCGDEGWIQNRRVCGRCVLRDQLLLALDDGTSTGNINPGLQPLLDHLLAMPRPRTGLLWLTKPHTLRLLNALAHQQVPLTHDGLSTLEPYRSVAHLRQLLIASRVLPQVDKTLLRIDQWTRTWLAGIDNPEHRRILERYARWHLQRRLHAAADRGRLHPYRDQSTRYDLRQPLEFLTWLQTAHTTLDRLSQPRLDKWAATARPAQRRPIRAFLRWATRVHLAPRLRLPQDPYYEAEPLTEHERIAWLGRILQDENIAHLERVAIALLLLYAQPLERITRLTVQDFAHDDKGRLTIRLGTPPAPVPAPFDELITTYIHHGRQPTLANQNTDLLFPGRHGTLPLHVTALRRRLNEHGLRPGAARGGSWRDLVTAAPPAVIAELLGYQSATAERTAKAAGNTWARYVSPHSSSL